MEYEYGTARNSVATSYRSDHYSIKHVHVKNLFKNVIKFEKEESVVDPELLFQIQQKIK